MGGFNLVYISGFWLRVIETVVFSIIIIAVLLSIIGIPYTIIPVILFFTYLLLCIVEYSSTTPIVHIFLPISLFGIGVLSSRMIYGTVNPNIYTYVIALYMFSIFLLYLTAYMMTRVILGERSRRFVEEQVLVDRLMRIFIVSSTTLILWLMVEGAIRIWASATLIALVVLTWLITRRYISKRAIELTIFRQLTRRKEVFKHPQEPEVERALLTLVVLLTIPVFMIPLLFMYTKLSLTQRSFIPLALLGVYEGMTCLLYIVFHTLSIHGAYIEELFRQGKEGIIDVEHYTVFKTWEDASWFLNRSIGYYYRARYLTALYMLFQGLEVLAKKHDLKDLYYKNLYMSLKEGYDYLKKNNLLRLTKQDSLEKTLDYFRNENTWVIEASTKMIEEESREVKELFKKLFVDLIDLYLAIKEEPERAIREKNKAIEATVIKLKNFIKSRPLKQEYKKKLMTVIEKLEKLKKKQQIRQEDLEFILEKKPLSINMLRNYLVHGQLVRNAIVYKGSRSKFDEIASDPSTLYSLYTLTIAYVVNEMSGNLL